MKRIAIPAIAALLAASIAHADAVIIIGSGSSHRPHWSYSSSSSAVWFGSGSSHGNCCRPGYGQSPGTSHTVIYWHGIPIIIDNGPSVPGYGHRPGHNHGDGCSHCANYEEGYRVGYRDGYYYGRQRARCSSRDGYLDGYRAGYQAGYNDRRRRPGCSSPYTIRPGHGRPGYPYGHGRYPTTTPLPQTQLFPFGLGNRTSSPNTPSWRSAWSLTGR